MIATQPTHATLRENTTLAYGCYADSSLGDHYINGILCSLADQYGFYNGSYGKEYAAFAEQGNDLAADETVREAFEMLQIVTKDGVWAFSEGSFILTHHE